MRSIPKTDFSIRTRRAPQEVQRLLKRNVGSRWEIFSHEPFTGSVEESTFHISLRIYGRNSFAPVLHGTIRADGEGSRVRIRARLHPSVVIFSIVWLGVTCRALFAGISMAAQGRSPSLASIAGIFLIGYVLLAGAAFFHGLRSAVQRLQELLA